MNIPGPNMGQLSGGPTGPQNTLPAGKPQRPITPGQFSFDAGGGGGGGSIGVPPGYEGGGGGGGGLTMGPGNGDGGGSIGTATPDSYDSGPAGAVYDMNARKAVPAKLDLMGRELQPTDMTRFADGVGQFTRGLTQGPESLRPPPGALPMQRPETMSGGPLQEQARFGGPQATGVSGDTATASRQLPNGTNARSVGLDQLRRRLANRTMAAGGPGAEAIAAERPVLAARQQMRQNVAAARQSGSPAASVAMARRAGRANIAAARQNPNSAMMERRARLAQQRQGRALPPRRAGRR